jgi:hypothetical protein
MVIEIVMFQEIFCPCVFRVELVYQATKIHIPEDPK